jgi:LytR_cpsA_psr family
VLSTDALGGVQVCVPAPGIHNWRSRLNISAGLHVISGNEALAFVRDRHGIGNGGNLDEPAASAVWRLVREDLPWTVHLPGATPARATHAHTPAARPATTKPASGVQTRNAARTSALAAQPQQPRPARRSARHGSHRRHEPGNRRGCDEDQDA